MSGHQPVTAHVLDVQSSGGAERLSARVSTAQSVVPSAIWPHLHRLRDCLDLLAVIDNPLKAIATGELRVGTGPPAREPGHCQPRHRQERREVPAVGHGLGASRRKWTVSAASARSWSPSRPRSSSPGPRPGRDRSARDDHPLRAESRLARPRDDLGPHRLVQDGDQPEPLQHCQRRVVDSELRIVQRLPHVLAVPERLVVRAP